VAGDVLWQVTFCGVTFCGVMFCGVTFCKGDVLCQVTFCGVTFCRGTLTTMQHKKCKPSAVELIIVIHYFNKFHIS
jgi:hypothetical protein